MTKDELKQNDTELSLMMRNYYLIPIVIGILYILELDGLNPDWLIGILLLWGLSYTFYSIRNVSNKMGSNELVLYSFVVFFFFGSLTLWIVDPWFDITDGDIDWFSLVIVSAVIYIVYNTQRIYRLFKSHKIRDISS